MPVDDERTHTNRRRAESFGGRAAQYDRVRPGYPAALIGELAGLGGECVLDVGCGTGKVAAALAARGVRVLGVEVDARMAEVARGKGIHVEVASFEQWDAAGRSFDLLVCGQAWHWIDPVAGAHKAAQLLRDGGRAALFWNLGTLAQPIRRAMDRLYAPLVPDTGVSVLRGGGRAVAPYLAPLRAAGLSRQETRRYEWEQRYTRAQWLELLATHSDHATLPPATFAELSRRVGALVDDLGGAVTVSYETQLLLAGR